MIFVDDFELYTNMMKTLKEKTHEMKSKLQFLHKEYHKIIFINSKTKKLYNQNLSFMHLLCKTKSLSFFEEIKDNNFSLINELLK